MVLAGRVSRQIPPFRSSGRRAPPDFPFGQPSQSRFSGGFLDPALLPDPFSGGSRSGGFLDPSLIEGGVRQQGDSRTPGQVDEGFGRGTFRDDPGLAFSTAINQAGLNRNLTDRFLARSRNFLQRFEGALGSELDKFGTQNLNPLDFFRGIDFENELSPRERGANEAGLNRANRFLF